jgi:hypothetical protein
MPQNRVFIPQEALDVWLSEERVTIEHDLLTLQPEGQQFRLQTAVRFLSEVAGGGDAHSLIGKVKDLGQITALGGDYSSGSVVLDPDAYEVLEGFVGEPLHDTATVISGDSLAGATRAAMGEPPTGEIDLLARFFLQSQ